MRRSKTDNQELDLATSRKGAALLRQTDSLRRRASCEAMHYQRPTGPTWIRALVQST